MKLQNSHGKQRPFPLSCLETKEQSNPCNHNKSTNPVFPASTPSTDTQRKKTHNSALLHVHKNFLAWFLPPPIKLASRTPPNPAARAGKHENRHPAAAGLALGTLEILRPVPQVRAFLRVDSLAQRLGVREGETDGFEPAAVGF